MHLFYLLFSVARYIKFNYYCYIVKNLDLYASIETLKSSYILCRCIYTINVDVAFQLYIDIVKHH